MRSAKTCFSLELFFFAQRVESIPTLETFRSNFKAKWLLKSQNYFETVENQLRKSGIDLGSLLRKVASQNSEIVGEMSSRLYCFEQRENCKIALLKTNQISYCMGACALWSNLYPRLRRFTFRDAGLGHGRSSLAGLIFKVKVKVKDFVSFRCSFGLKLASWRVSELRITSSL